jgi:hypothetical protein
VSVRHSAELSEDERRYENGVQPKVLDIIAIPLTAANPQPHQSENYVIDSNSSINPCLSGRLEIPPKTATTIASNWRLLQISPIR